MAETNELLRRANAAKKPAQDANAVQPGHAPAVRKGEDSMSSRPFNMIRLFGVLGGQIPRENAKVELELTGNFRKALSETQSLIQSGGGGSTYMVGARSYLPDEAAYHPATTAL